MSVGTIAIVLPVSSLFLNLLYYGVYCKADQKFTLRPVVWDWFYATLFLPVNLSLLRILYPLLGILPLSCRAPLRHVGELHAPVVSQFKLGRGPHAEVYLGLINVGPYCLKSITWSVGLYLHYCSEVFLCPVRALRRHIDVTSRIRHQHKRLFLPTIEGVLRNNCKEYAVTLVTFHHSSGMLVWIYLELPIHMEFGCCS